MRELLARDGDGDVEAAAAGDRADDSGRSEQDGRSRPGQRQHDRERDPARNRAVNGREHLVVEAGRRVRHDPAVDAVPQPAVPDNVGEPRGGHGAPRPGRRAGGRLCRACECVHHAVSKPPRPDGAAAPARRPGQRRPVGSGGLPSGRSSRPRLRPETQTSGSSGTVQSSWWQPSGTHIPAGQSWWLTPTRWFPTTPHSGRLLRRKRLILPPYKDPATRCCWVPVSADAPRRSMLGQMVRGEPMGNGLDSSQGHDQ